MEVSLAWDTKYNKYIYAISKKYNQSASEFKILDHRLQDKCKDESDRNTRYTCVECDGFLTPVRPLEIRWHFRHQSGDCTSDRNFIISNESDTHKLAKYTLAGLIKKRANITILGSSCVELNCQTSLPPYTLQYKVGDKVKIEFIIDENNNRADVAVVNNGEIRYIFEVYYTSKTKSSRKDPWFEIRAVEILENDCKDDVFLKDIKDHTCDSCKSCQQIVHNLCPIILQPLCKRIKLNIHNLNINIPIFKCLKCSSEICKDEGLCTKCEQELLCNKIEMIPKETPLIQCMNYMTDENQNLIKYFEMKTCENYLFCQNEVFERRPFCLQCGLYTSMCNGWNKLDIRDTELKCDICNIYTGREMKHPYCNAGHYFCISCSRNILLWDEIKYHLSPVPYGCPPCPNKCNNPIKGRQCYCEEYNVIQSLWKINKPYQYEKWSDTESDSIHNSGEMDRSCPLCRPEHKCLKIDIIEKKPSQTYTNKRYYNRVYLHVPYKDKDRAKKLGCRWDSDRGQWYYIDEGKSNVYKKFPLYWS